MTRTPADPFSDAPSVFEALGTVRTRRIGQGYRIDSGTAQPHPVTGRPVVQADGPLAHTSVEEPIPLRADEAALVAWAGCGPNGLVTWDLPIDGAFHELASLRGRTYPHPANTLAAALIVVDDDGTWLYDPRPAETGPVTHADIDRWWDERRQIGGHRPNLDWGLRAPGFEHASLMGPYQQNLNRPGSTWFLPVTDAGAIGRSLSVFFADWRHFPVDDLDCRQPAGVGPWIRPGMLEFPVSLTGLEQRFLLIESYPVGAIVQNMRLASESLGLGAWCFCGFSSEVALGGAPSVSSGLGFAFAEKNSRAPFSAGDTKGIGIPGVFESTFVPSPRFPDGETLVAHWRSELWGERLTPVADDEVPWTPQVAERIAADGRTRTEPWVWEAVAAHVDYCVERYGQWPVTFNPLQAQFGVVVHHLDLEFYDQHYRAGTVTERHRSHMADWHGGST